VYRLSASDGDARKDCRAPAPIWRLKRQLTGRRPLPYHAPPQCPLPRFCQHQRVPSPRQPPRTTRRGPSFTCGVAEEQGSSAAVQVRLTGRGAPTARALAAHPAAPPRRRAPGRTPRPHGRRRRRRRRRGARRLQAPASTVSAASGSGSRARPSHAQVPRRQPFQSFRGAEAGSGHVMLSSRELSFFF